MDGIALVFDFRFLYVPGSLSGAPVGFSTDESTS